MLPTPLLQAENMEASTSPSPIIAFYEGTGTDNCGRSLAEILQWSADELEDCHNYIQMLFPLPERSVFNDPAPIIDQEVFEAFRARKDLRDRLRDSFMRILWFYGFELIEDEAGGDTIVLVPDLDRHVSNWHTYFNHNHLRMTRIIRSLRVLGLEKEALAFFDAISHRRRVSLESRMYWRRAARRPLHIAPDLDSEDAHGSEPIGPLFLQPAAESPDEVVG